MARDARAQLRGQHRHFADVDAIAGRQQHVVEAPGRAFERKRNAVAVGLRAEDALTAMHRHMLEAVAQPSDCGGAQRAFIQGVACSLRQTVDNAGRFIQPVIGEGADLRRRDQAVAEHGAHAAAQTAAGLRVGVPYEMAAREDLDLDAGFRAAALPTRSRSGRGR